MHESASKDETFATLQLNADCLDDVPPDYGTPVGGDYNNPISGASEVTVNESSVVLDPAGRATDPRQLHPGEDAETRAAESHSLASCEYKQHTLVAKV